MIRLASTEKLLGCIEHKIVDAGDMAPDLAGSGCERADAVILRPRIFMEICWNISVNMCPRNQLLYTLRHVFSKWISIPYVPTDLPDALPVGAHLQITLFLIPKRLRVVTRSENVKSRPRSGTIIL